MVHGGPFPATSDGRSTSVGTLAIERFLRPVCYQDIPDALLPAVLRRDASQLAAASIRRRLSSSRSQSMSLRLVQVRAADGLARRRRRR